MLFEGKFEKVQEFFRGGLATILLHWDSHCRGGLFRAQVDQRGAQCIGVQLSEYVLDTKLHAKYLKQS
jgi:hypothetical protein